MYRFRYDDIALRNTTKQGYLTKKSTWRNKVRYYIYNAENKSLLEYKTAADEIPLYSYPLTNDTIVSKVADDELAFSITLPSSGEGKGNKSGRLRRQSSLQDLNGESSIPILSKESEKDNQN
eukprot:UN01882